MAVPEELEQVADRLYALPPQQFVAERDAAVTAAREAGDAATAAALRQLRRPGVAVWLVNLLALRRPELLADLADLAAELRAAQQDLDGVRLRELATRRRTAVSGLVAAARSLAVAVAPGMAGKLPLAEVEGMLGAAVSSPAVAAQVRSGRLVRPVAADGFGELPPPRLRLIPGGADPGTGAGRSGDAEPGPPAPDRSVAPDRAAVVAALAVARAGLAAAQADTDRAGAAEHEAKQALTRLEAELAALAARRADLTRELAEAQAAVLATRRELVAARRRAGAAEAVLATLDESPQG